MEIKQDHQAILGGKRNTIAFILTELDRGINHIINTITAPQQGQCKKQLTLILTEVISILNNFLPLAKSTDAAMDTEELNQKKRKRVEQEQHNNQDESTNCVSSQTSESSTPKLPELYPLGITPIKQEMSAESEKASNDKLHDIPKDISLTYSASMPSPLTIGMNKTVCLKLEEEVKSSNRDHEEMRATVLEANALNLLKDSTSNVVQVATKMDSYGSVNTSVTIPETILTPPPAINTSYTPFITTTYGKCTRKLKRASGLPKS